MKIIEKGKPAEDAVHLSWDAGQAALASGAYDLVSPTTPREADQPAAQMPAPGTDPVDGEEKAADGQVLTNMAPTVPSGVVSAGLPKSPAPPQPAPAKVPLAPQPAPKPDGKPA